jgi:hypothetical protein
MAECAMSESDAWTWWGEERERAHVCRASTLSLTTTTTCRYTLPITTFQHGLYTYFQRDI